MADTRSKRQDRSEVPSEVTVEYIKENDFGPAFVKKYAGRTVPRSKRRSSGKGYFSRTSDTMVKSLTHSKKLRNDKRATRSSTGTSSSVGASNVLVKPEERPEPIPSSSSSKNDEIPGPPGKAQETSPSSIRSRQSTIVENTISTLVNLFGEKRSPHGSPTRQTHLEAPRPSPKGARIARLARRLSTSIDSSVTESPTSNEPASSSGTTFKATIASRSRSKTRQESILEQLDNVKLPTTEPVSSVPSHSGESASVVEASGVDESVGSEGLGRRKRKAETTPIAPVKRGRGRPKQNKQLGDDTENVTGEGEPNAKSRKLSPPMEQKKTGRRGRSSHDRTASPQSLPDSRASTPVSLEDTTTLTRGRRSRSGTPLSLEDTPGPSGRRGRGARSRSSTPASVGGRGRNSRSRSSTPMSRPTTPQSLEETASSTGRRGRGARSRSSTPASVGGRGRKSRSRSSTPMSRSPTSVRSGPSPPDEQPGGAKRKPGRPPKKKKGDSAVTAGGDGGRDATSAAVGRNKQVPPGGVTRRKRRGRVPRRYVEDAGVEEQGEKVAKVTETVANTSSVMDPSVDTSNDLVGENEQPKVRRKGRLPRRRTDSFTASVETKKKDLAPEITTPQTPKPRENRTGKKVKNGKPPPSEEAGTGPKEEEDVADKSSNSPGIVASSRTPIFNPNLKADKQKKILVRLKMSRRSAQTLFASESDPPVPSVSESLDLAPTTPQSLITPSPTASTPAKQKYQNISGLIQGTGGGGGGLGSGGGNAMMMNQQLSFSTSTPVTSHWDAASPSLVSPILGMKLPVSVVGSGGSPLSPTSSTDLPSARHVKCPTCDRVYTKRYLKYHLKKCPGPNTSGPNTSATAVSERSSHVGLGEDTLANWSLLQNTTTDTTGTPDSSTAGKKGGRSAARKARTSIKSFINEMGETAEKEVKYKFVKAKEKGLTKYFLAKWGKELEETGAINCPYHHCPGTQGSIEEMEKHYTGCSFKPQRDDYYECIRCKTRRFNTKEEVEAHSNKHNWKIDAAEEAADVDYQVASDSEGEGASKTAKKRPIHPSFKRRAPPSGRGPIERVSDRLDVVHTLKWTLQWRTDHKQTDMSVFDRWRPRAKRWNRISQETAETYLPQSLMSPWFIHEQKDETRSNKTFINRFSATTDGINLLYTGGPVWSQAWLPREDTVVSGQYLAVYAHRQYDRYHTIMRSSASPSAIQIWACHKMDKNVLEQVPRLSLVLTLPDGPVWDMKWCPRLSYHDNPHSDTLPLLGFLAAATSSGKIHIFSVPEPESLEDLDQPGLPVYSPGPMATLLPVNAGYTGRTKYGVCLSLDWQCLGGTRRVLAGYSDGTVSVYDLGTTFPLLRVEGEAEGEGDSIHPVITFTAHHAAVTGVAFNQRRPDYFSTVSQDRNVKVWNMEQLQYPINSVPKSEFTAVAWPLHWPVTLGATDNCYSLEHNAVFLIDAGYFGLQNRPLTVHNASITDVSFSDWLNTLVSVDTAGVVESIYLPLLLSVHKHHKAFSSRRMVLFTVDCVPLDPCQCTSPTRSSDVMSCVCTKCQLPIPDEEEVTSPKKKKEKEDYGNSAFLSSVQKVMDKMDTAPCDARPSSVEEMKETYAMVYKDGEMNAINTRREVKISSAKELKQDTAWPLLAAQNKTEWNPNLGCHLWHAVAGESGLVRLVHLPLFSTRQEQEFVTEVLNKNQETGEETNGHTS